MRAMVFHEPHRQLVQEDWPKPAAANDQVIVKVLACAVCRTDLHVVDGELPNPKLPLIPGHEIVGVVVEKGADVDAFAVGDRVGIAWLGWTCGKCRYCRSGHENLCADAKFTGYTLDGGYAEYAVADSRFCFPIPERYENEKAAPLLCAGLIGYRSLKKAGDAENLGIYGFGAAAHIITQVAKFQGRRVFAFTRPGDERSQRFALQQGADWTGGSDTNPPVELDAGLIFAPVGALVPAALRSVRKGGTVVCGGIHMSDIPSMPYELLWHEKMLCSVANLTRADGHEFLDIASRFPIHVSTTAFPLEQANQALESLRSGGVDGAAVLIMQGSS